MLYLNTGDSVEPCAQSRLAKDQQEEAKPTGKKKESKAGPVVVITLAGLSVKGNDLAVSDVESNSKSLIMTQEKAINDRDRAG